MLNNNKEQKSNTIEDQLYCCVSDTMHHPISFAILIYIFLICMIKTYSTAPLFLISFSIWVLLYSVKLNENDQDE